MELPDISLILPNQDVSTLFSHNHFDIMLSLVISQRNVSLSEVFSVHFYTDDTTGNSFRILNVYVIYGRVIANRYSELAP